MELKASSNYKLWIEDDVDVSIPLRLISYLNYEMQQQFF